ncbi:group II intron reverse transcriptase/maturase [Burkholderia cenocepacia]|uniref:group II intron reverse transcriptase/maturase n=1 Tax=Burkholderia cenocepacia TaxID=95486 RepID=UPI002AB5E668|nr:group II intron reverse transcriptase/maturase [Burkholderia cenocepacia]
MISKPVMEAEALETAAEHARGGRKPPGCARGAQTGTATYGRTKSEGDALMERVVERGNMRRAYRRVLRNEGSAGVDGLSVEGLGDWLKMHWPSVKQALLEGTYIPRAIRRVDIPKPQGGVRTLGVPTVVDRLIQQALHQVLQPILEPTFSASSYGFRPGKSALDAVRQAQAYVQGGRHWVVDIDLEKFFDRVNHDVLMARVARHVQDKVTLKLIRRFLEAGMMAAGVTQARTEGTPQGGPLSPLLSNILLSDLDRRLESRGLAFCRYADDCNIYVGSKQAGQRVMAGIRAYLEKVLKLRVNETKSAVARPSTRKFLGYRVAVRLGQAHIRIAPESIKRLMTRVRELTVKGRSWSLEQTIQKLNPVLRGWANYFRLSQQHKRLEGLDGWLRRRLRCLIWRQWKRSRTRERNMIALGLHPERAWKSSVNGRGPWWNAGSHHLKQALPNAYFDARGLISIRRTVDRLQSIN